MQDFKLNAEMDLEIKNGDFDIGDTDQQNIELILLAHKGNFKEHPILGVGIASYLKSPEIISRLRLENEINNQLEFDNFKVKDLDVNDLQNICIDGTY